jgi:hypothetical protein
MGASASLFYTSSNRFVQEDLYQKELQVVREIQMRFFVSKDHRNSESKEDRRDRGLGARRDGYRTVER